MGKLAVAWMAVLAAALPLDAASGQETGVGPDLAASAERFVARLEHGDFSAAAKNFDEIMTKAMPPEKLEGAWKSVVAQAGPLKRRVGVGMAKVPKYDVAVVTCEFEKSTLDVKVVYDGEGKITGLWFAPSASAAKYEPPPYAKQDSFEEKEVSFGSWLWTLPGTLTLPQGDGPFPAVVLVHGSGPNDRDETIGPNKPFRDLAWGLASRGIAVFRYEKRTKKHALKLAVIKGSITVKEETIDDALAAVALLRKTERIDPDRVFVLGHSLGGMLVPRIGARDPDLAGLILLAATSRPLEDVILAQSRWLFMLDGELSEEDEAQLQKIEEQVARVKDPQLSPETPAADLPLGVHPAYWLDLRGYDPPEAAKSLKQPLLVLHGQRDYQVTMQDFDRWRQALCCRDDVHFKLYPKCNHLFVEGEGRSTPAEYQTPGNVAQPVVDDIANWIGKRQ